MAIDKLAQMLEMDFNQEKFSAYFAKKKIDGEDIILLKPTTYMNNSGIALRQCMDFYKVPSEDILVLYDDMEYALAATAIKYQMNYSEYLDAVEELSADARVELLDALCDQVVTAVGVAYMMGMDIEGALAEVNRSNWSKFEGGVPVFNEQGKIAKGVEYTPPELSDYI